jgi:acetyl esterase/lipase
MTSLTACADPADSQGSGASDSPTDDGGASEGGTDASDIQEFPNEVDSAASDTGKEVGAAETEGGDGDGGDTTGGGDTGDPDGGDPPDVETPPVDSGKTTSGTSFVKSDATFEVQVTSNLKYGTGVINTWGPKDDTMVDLLLDVYEPKNAPGEKKPVLMIIHGGGFVGGSKTQKQLTMFGEFFAARGFVCFSVDYRVAKQEGSLPSQWPTDPETIQPGMKAAQLKALYPAGRDVKMAVRWVRENASKYGIDPEAVAAMGGSAGAFLALMLGVSNEDDYKSEIDYQSDPFLLEGFPKNSSKVAAVIDLWGGTALLDAVKFVDGQERFDADDAPVAIIHGTEDKTVPFTEAQEIKAAYDKTGVPYAFYPLDAGHGAWNKKIDGQNLAKVSFDFIVTHLKLTLE